MAKNASSIVIGRRSNTIEVTVSISADRFAQISVRQAGQIADKLGRQGIFETHPLQVLVTCSWGSILS